MLSVSVWAMKRPVRMTKFAVFEWECRKERKIYIVEMCCLFAWSYRGNSYHLELKRLVVKTMQDAQVSETFEIPTEWFFMSQSHRCVVVPSQRKSMIHEGDEIKVVLTRLIRADNLCCSTLMNGGFLCIYPLLSSIETIYLLSGTSCQDVDFFLIRFPWCWFGSNF